jgi:iron complex transport system permease protein
MGLDDGVARNLGLALSLARLAALTLAIVLSALLVNAVGIIGFIGLFAPLLAKMLGARRLLTRLLVAPLIGALILWLSDQIILWLTRVWMEVSTGSVTAIIGAPLLLWLLPRLRSMSAPAMNAGDKVSAERHHVLWYALAGGLLLLLAVMAALAFGRDAQGWHWASGALLDELMPWRGSRVEPIHELTEALMNKDPAGALFGAICPRGSLPVSLQECPVQQRRNQLPH